MSWFPWSSTTLKWVKCLSGMPLYFAAEFVLRVRATGCLQTGSFLQVLWWSKLDSICRLGGLYSLHSDVIIRPSSLSSKFLPYIFSHIPYSGKIWRGISFDELATPNTNRQFKNSLTFLNSLRVRIYERCSMKAQNLFRQILVFTTLMSNSPNFLPAKFSRYTVICLSLFCVSSK